MLSLPKPTAEKIIHSIRKDIFSGHINEGQALKQDELATKYGVSKIPVREALLQLKSEGLVNFLPNKGAQVSKLSPADVDEIYSMRIALETVALKRAIPNLTVSHLNHAQSIISEIDVNEDIVILNQLHWDFHLTLYTPSAMPKLLESIKALYINVGRYLAIYLKIQDYQSGSQDDHKKLLEACRYGNIDLATELLQEHLKIVCKQLMNYLQDKQSHV